MSVTINRTSRKWYALAGRIGLSAKGVVYSLSGLVAVFAAFHFQGKTAQDAGQKGVFDLVSSQPMGNASLLAITAGLCCCNIRR